MTPILLLDEYLTQTLRKSLGDALTSENAQALGIAFTCSANHIDHHSPELTTLLLQKNANLKKDEGEGTKWVFNFVRYDDVLQHPLWSATKILCDTLGGKQMHLMAWFFKDKLVVERIDAPSSHIHISADATQMSHHQKLTLTDKLIQVGQNWTPHLNACQLLPPALVDR